MVLGGDVSKRKLLKIWESFVIRRWRSNSVISFAWWWTQITVCLLLVNSGTSFFCMHFLLPITWSRKECKNTSWNWSLFCHLILFVFVGAAFLMKPNNMFALLRRCTVVRIWRVARRQHPGPWHTERFRVSRRAYRNRFFYCFVPAWRTAAYLSEQAEILSKSSLRIRQCVFVKELNSNVCIVSKFTEITESNINIIDVDHE